MLPDKKYRLRWLKEKSFQFEAAIIACANIAEADMVAVEDAVKVADAAEEESFNDYCHSC